MIPPGPADEPPPPAAARCRPDSSGPPDHPGVRGHGPVAIGGLSIGDHVAPSRAAPAPGGPNTSVIDAMLGVFVCPSDVDRPTRPMGRLNDFLNAGSDAYSPFVPTPTAAIATDCGTPLSSAVRFASIADGTSDTAASSEKTKKVGGNVSDDGDFDPMTPSSSPTLRTSAAYNSEPGATQCNGTPAGDYQACQSAGAPGRPTS